MKNLNMISRRSFLKAAAAATVVSALGLTGCGSSGSSAAASRRPLWLLLLFLPWH